MAKIKRIILTPFAMKRKSVRFALGSSPVAEHVLVRVVTDDGIVGLGEAPARPFFYGETPGSIMSAVAELIAPKVLGLDLNRIDAIRRLLSGIIANQTARGAFEHAVCDAIGKTFNVPYRAMFGGTGEPIIASWLLGLGEPVEVVEKAVQAQEEYGAFAFKVKVGKDWRAEVRVVEALRQRFGRDARLYLDANLSFPPVDALRMAEAVRDLDIEYFEEPCPIVERSIRQRIQEYLPVMSDESALTTREAHDAIVSGASNMLNIKPARHGLSASHWLLQLMEMNGAGAMAGTQLETSIGTAATVLLADSSHVTRARPAEASMFLMLEGDLVQEPLQFVKGCIPVPTGPGFGMTLDEAALRRFTTPLGERTIS